MTNRDIIDLMHREISPALGCTEPIAVALACAKAHETLGCLVDTAEVTVSRNIFKNAMGVGIPGTSLIGLPIAAALGLLKGCSAYGLEVLRDAMEAETIEAASKLAASGAIRVITQQDAPKLYIAVKVTGGGHEAVCVIRDHHRNVSRLTLDQQVVFEGCHNCDTETVILDNTPTLEEIWRFVQEAALEDFAFLHEGVAMNLRIAEEGLSGAWGIQVGKTLLANRPVHELPLGEYVSALTAAASDARMSGCVLPVMSTAGSGNQGLTATLPVYAAAQKLGISEAVMLRAEALSQLVTIHIKANIGSLSALCGCAVAASIGSACGITYLLGGTLEEVSNAVQNMIADISGLICDGAKPGCALKIATATACAVQCAQLAASGACATRQDGIVNGDVEASIRNLRTLSQQGMQQTDTTILDIMLTK